MQTPSAVIDSPHAASGDDYERLFEILPYGVLRYDAAGAIREANPAASRVLGIPPDELKGRTATDRGWQVLDANGHPMEPKDFPLAASIRSAEPVRDFLIAIFSATLRRHIWLRGDVIPQQTAGRHETQYWVIFHDVTEEYEAHGALMESRSNLDLAQRVASVGSAVYNYRKRRWSWSAQLFRLYGIKEGVRQHVSPEALSYLVDIQDREPYLHGLEVGSQGVVPYPLEFTLVRADGSKRIVYREAELIEDSAGVAGIIFTHKDITEAREAEYHKEILQGQLYHAQRLEALGTLASGIAHDINNTLVPIIGLTQAIQAAPDTSPQLQPLLALIEGAGIRARDLVRRVLDFSRKAIPQRTLFDLSVAVLETMKLARASIPPRIELRQEIGNVGLFEGDATQVHQLLLNLVTNAAQAMGDTNGEITVRLSPSGQDPSYIVLEVADTGPGMDPETQKRIFEPFFTTKSVGAGTGLGLSMVHGIVRSHGGTIDVASEPGRGSCFSIHLPRHQPRADEKSSCH